MAGSWPTGIGAITLFVPDKEGAKSFYATAFDLPVFFEDEVSVVFKLGSTLVNLLARSEAEDLVAPARVAPEGSASQGVYTIEVESVDEACSQLADRGVELLNGPIDRPWGVRTASFADPAGHLWELAQPIGGPTSNSDDRDG